MESNRSLATSPRLAPPLAIGIAAAGLLLGLWVVPAESQDLRKQIEASGQTEAQVREQIRASRLTPEQIREALRQAGYNPDALEPMAPDSLARAPGQSAQPSSGALSEPPPTLAPNRVLGPSAAEMRSDFEAEITRRVGASEEIRPFGYEIFSYSPTTFEPLAAGPVDPDYPVGPGDEVIITMWGDQEFTHAATVSREGAISVPDIGLVVLNGLTLAESRRLITQRLAAVHSGIARQRPTTFVDVTLGKLRTIQVFILGDVVRPGGYTISSVSTVLNALYSAGGPTPRGSMRDVRIVRHDRLFRQVDLYGYILSGSKVEDIRLQTGDVLFVPPVGKIVAILGEVHRPAIYELAPSEHFRSLLGLAGGVQSTALVSRALVDRIVPFSMRDSLPGQDRIAVDVPLRQVIDGTAPDPMVVDRDIVRIFRVGDLRKNTVSIEGGGVYHAGTHEWRPGMRASDLVNEAGGLRPDAYLDRALVVRTDENRVRHSLAFDLGRALRGDAEANLMLQPLDGITVQSIWDVRDRYTVSIHGNVRKPGSYEFLEGMTITNLIFQAGGLTESAFPDEVEVSRVDSTTIASTRGARIFRVPISRGYGFGEDGDASFVLQPHDQVFVREIPDWQLQRNVTISGEVSFPGVYSLRSHDERLSSLLARAGGLKPTAYPRASTFIRKKAGAGRLAVDVEDVARRRRSRYDLILEDGDDIHIPREPKTVKVVGEVGVPASVLFERGRPLGYYVEQAGGYGEKADRKRVRVIQPTGRVKGPGGLWSDPQPEAGALVIVPQKAPEEKSETLKDIATIMTIISTAATTIFLARQVTK